MTNNNSAPCQISVIQCKTIKCGNGIRIRSNNFNRTYIYIYIILYEYYDKIDSKKINLHLMRHVNSFCEFHIYQTDCNQRTLGNPGQVLTDIDTMNIFYVNKYLKHNSVSYCNYIIILYIIVNCD